MILICEPYTTIEGYTPPYAAVKINRKLARLYLHRMDVADQQVISDNALAWIVFWDYSVRWFDPYPRFKGGMLFETPVDGWLEISKMPKPPDSSICRTELSTVVITPKDMWFEATEIYMSTEIETPMITREQLQEVVG